MSDFTSTLLCRWPVYRVSSSSISESVLAVSRLGSFVFFVGNGIRYIFATRMVINAAYMNTWPQSAQEIVLPLNICRIAKPANATSRCSRRPGPAANDNAPKQAHLHVKPSESENHTFQIPATSLRLNTS